MNITAVIPVRAGSRRLPNKNILSFGDSNLLIHKIRQLKQVPQINNIIVSTDSEEMIKMAVDEGVDYQRRPIEYCDEKSKTFNEVVEYIAGSINADVMAWIPCVCPLVETETYIKALKEFENLGDNYDSVVSAILLKEYIFDEYGPVNFSIEHHVPSQKLPDWHIIKNGFFIAPGEKMAEWKFVYGKKPKLVELSKFEAIDIDDMSDLKLAEYVYERRISGKNQYIGLYA